MLDPDVAAHFLACRQRMTRTGRQPGTSPTRWASCRWHWSRPPRTCRPPAATVAGYLALFRQRRGDLLSRGAPAGHRETVASTWALAFDRLQQTTPGAVGLLRLLAYCASEAIPLPLLLQRRHGLAGLLGDQAVPVLAPLLDDQLAAGDAVAGAAPVFASDPRRRWMGVAAPASPGRYRRSDASRAGQRMAAGRRRADRGGDPRRHRPAWDLAGMRGAATARPGGSRRRQRRDGPDCRLPGIERQLRRSPRSPAQSP